MASGKVDSGTNKHSNAPGFGSGNGSGPKVQTFKPKRHPAPVFKKPSSKSY